MYQFVSHKSTESRRANVGIWEDTYELTTSGKFKGAEIMESVKFSFSDLSHIQPQYQINNPIIEVVNEDTFSSAQRLKESGYSPLVLNMANHLCPGGGVRKGAHAQEENLFRRSNYHKFLPHVLYPIQDDEVIYSPNVLVIKDKNYDLLSKPFEVACIACAGIHNPKIDWFGSYKMFSNNEDYLLTREKIYAIFKTACLYGHDSLVLGALGCGAFHNPPEVIAQIFNDALRDYKHCFKYICFAVYSINDPNYDIFSKYIST